MTVPPHWRPHIAAVGITLASLGLRLGLVVFLSFDGLYGQDPYFFYGQATQLRRALSSGGALPTTNWPAGYPLLMSLLLPMTNQSPAAGQLLSLAAGTALAPVIFYLTREVLRPYGERAALRGGVFAGLLTAANGQLLQSSIVVMSDSTALLFAALGIWASVRYIREPRAWWLTLAAIACSGAVITRWEYAILAPCLAAYFVTDGPSIRVLARHVLPAAPAAVLVLGIQAILAKSLIAIAGGASADGWSLANLLGHRFQTNAGSLEYSLPNLLFYLKPLISPGYLFPGVVVLCLLGLFYLFRDRRYGLVLLFSLWWLAVYFVLAGLPFQNFRYSLAYLIPVVVTAAVGLVLFLPSVAPRIRKTLALSIMSALLAMTGWGMYRAAGLVGRWQDQKLLAKWVDQRVPSNTLLICNGFTLMLRYETTLRVWDLFELDRDSVEALYQDSEVAYLLLDVDRMNTKWAGLAPEQNYRWLRRHFDFEEIGRRDRFTLFRMDRGNPDR